MIIERDIMVAARDGVRLATDIYRPEGVGPFSVILERTPYDKAAASRSEITATEPTPRSREAVARYFVEAGYAVAFQDCRGRYRSEGGFTKYLSETPDGYDTCAWLVAQPWCNGRIATMGLSYAAHAQMALGCLDAPGLAAQYIDCGGFSNAYRSGIRNGGAFDLKQATWAYRNALADAKDPAVKAALQAENIANGWRACHGGPVIHHQGGAGIRGLPVRAMVARRFRRLSETARHLCRGVLRPLRRCADGASVGRYDPYARTAMENYAGLAGAKRGPVRLVLGPWTHGDRSLSFAGDVEFGPAATLDGNLGDDFFAVRRRWFDCWVKGIDNGVAREPSVRVFVMGGGSGRKTAEGRLDHGRFWRAAEAWPLPGTRFTPFYLHPGRSLLVARPGDGAPLSFVADPRDPVPTIGGALSSGGPVMYGGAYDQRTGPEIFGAKPPYGPLAARPDLLVFQTPPLPEDLEIAGPLELRLWVASDGPDADIHAKLIDLYPPSEDYPEGFAINLCEGLLRLRYRNCVGGAEGLGAGSALPGYRGDVSLRQSVQTRPQAAARPRRQQLPTFRHQSELRRAGGIDGTPAPR